jgi:hypothetical protein
MGCTGEWTAEPVETVDSAVLTLGRFSAFPL